MRLRYLSWAAVALLAMTISAAAGSVIAQEARPVMQVLMVCGGCHNPDPGTLPAAEAQRIPRLGGQQSEYLRAALEGYRLRLRDHFYMRGMAAGLRGAELDAAVRYLSMPEAGAGRKRASVAPPPQAAQRCVACHGSSEQQPATAQTPRLAGQHAAYIETAFLAYAQGARKHEVMGAQAKNANDTLSLTEAELAEVAAWFSRQNGLVPR